MNDSSISATRLFIVAMWTLSILILLTAWAVALFAGKWNVAELIALTSVPSLLGAGLGHIRYYTLRVCRLVRATSGAEHPGGSLHRV
jgi:hypothetical protein